VDLLARLHSNDPALAKRVLDCGADGIIVPSVNTPDQARQAVAMATFPPDGTRGVSLCRASDFGRGFDAYFHQHNQDVLVVVMLEHIDAVKQAGAILATPGIDATFIGPYDLSASMGLPGALNHADVLAAQQTILDACQAHAVPAGIHVVPVDQAEVARRIEQGFRFIACGVDTEFIKLGCREMLRRNQPDG
jgi:2-dehydro-3-deoxyglucarate aldolase